MFDIAQRQPGARKHTGGMHGNVFTASFRRAAAKLGGISELAVFLQTPLETVEHWLVGTLRPPVSAFLRVVDCITSKDPSDPYGR